MAILLLFVSVFLISSSEAFVGVTLDTEIKNLPKLLDIGNAVNRSVLRHVRLFNMDTNVISAFADYNLHMIISSNSVENNSRVIDSFWQQDLENRWASALLPWAGKIDMLVFAGQFIGGCCNEDFRVKRFFDVMRRLQYTFNSEHMMKVKVTTIVNVSAVIENVGPPSEACVRPEYYERMKNLLNILRENNAPLLVNIHPFYEYEKNPTDESLLFCLFLDNSGRYDPGSGLTYHNMFDWQLDAVRNAIDGLEYEDIEIIVAETGWPTWSHGSGVGASKENARNYNKHMVHHLSSNLGTPMRPKSYVKAYIHTLFDQNKTHTDLNYGFGLLNHDLTWRYNVV